ncbi:cupin domain-containing protein [Paraburkholderia diazotrophica]|uniref:Mannose-6-phosphate isomerase, cupin superfamily n=1 Tax=Paraburkholderia diazotrophica TaxID=667676 RepID=A0A1H7EK96_9BURK|nr:cupin domain-containing protein [Paraburkholderia diazotrophica]SEK14024.1 Mannose-6-phosphate isomerase, cupin superfamily [Paraburkholderia diazotrophica]
MNDENIPLANSKVLYKTLLIEENYAVSQTTVLPGGETEWHHHTNVRDRFVVVQGILTVETKVGELVDRKQVDDHYTVEPGVIHHVRNETFDNVVYINVQSGGERDIVLA